jgi:hypothetical protein
LFEKTAYFFLRKKLIPEKARTPNPSREIIPGSGTCSAEEAETSRPLRLKSE